MQRKESLRWKLIWEINTGSERTAVFNAMNICKVVIVEKIFPLIEVDKNAEQKLSQKSNASKDAQMHFNAFGNGNKTLMRKSLIGKKREK